MSNSVSNYGKARDFFQGIAVVIDDKVELETSEDRVSHSIFETLREQGIPVAPYKELPKKEAYPSIEMASMIILDWQLSESLNGATTLAEGEEEDKLSFLEEIVNDSIVPIFVISNNISQAREAISQKTSLKGEIDNRIIFREKRDFEGEELTDTLFTLLNEWLEKRPAIYALKEWAKVADAARNKMYHDFAFVESSWANIMWKRMKQDVGINSDSDKRDHLRKIRLAKDEFGEFITRNIINRFEKFDFDDSQFEIPNNADDKSNSTGDILRQVLVAERFSKATNSSEDSIDLRTGDLFRSKNSRVKYYLVITADCDLARGNNENNDIFCLSGSRVGKSQIAPYRICDNDNKDSLIRENGDSIEIDNLKQDDLKEELKRLIRLWNRPKQSYGVIHSETQKAFYLVAAVDGVIAIKFDLSISVKKGSEFLKCAAQNKECNDQNKMIYLGRVVAPYINQIQRAAARWMIRQGNLPVPDEFFNEVW